jgi:hypothetical protein
MLLLVEWLATLKKTNGLQTVLTYVNGNSGDLYQFGTKLPCSSKNSYDDNGYLIGSIYTQSAQLFNYSYTYKCK